MFIQSREVFAGVLTDLADLTFEDHEAIETILTVQASGKKHRASIALYLIRHYMLTAEQAVLAADAYYAIRMAKPVLQR